MPASATPRPALGKASQRGGFLPLASEGSSLTSERGTTGPRLSALNLDVWLPKQCRAALTPVSTELNGRPPCPPCPGRFSVLTVCVSASHTFSQICSQASLGPPSPSLHAVPPARLPGTCPSQRRVTALLTCPLHARPRCKLAACFNDSAE